MEDKSIIKLYCNKCKCETLHLPQWHSETTEYFNEELDLEDKSEYFVYECHNCGEFCYVKITSFIDGNELVHKNINRYPKSTKGVKKISNIESLPEVFRNIYHETFIAIINKCYVLAMVGIASIVETFVLEHYDKKYKLFDGIKKLKDEGIIGEKDKELFDGIRCMRNKAAHEIKVYSEKEIYKVFHILNNILENQYCIELLEKNATKKSY